MNKRKKQDSNRNKTQDVHIEGVAAQGWGIAGKGRERVHVWGGLLGDHLRIGHFRRERGRGEAAIESVIHRSVTTESPACEHFGVCGGCLWQHVPYETQLVMKREIVKSCFANARLDTSCVLPVLACDDPLFYRNKNDFTFGFGQEPALGFFESEVKISGGRQRPQRGRVPNVFQVNSCSLQTALADRILGLVRTALLDSGLSYFHPGSRRGILRSLVIRQSAQSGDVLLHFVAARDCGETLRPIAERLLQEEPHIKGVVLSVNNKRSKNAVPQMQDVLAGEDGITEKILGLNIRVSPSTFLQVNTHQAEKMYALAIEMANLTDESQVIDLYCGTGSLSLLLAQHAGKVVGIEVVEAAVLDAKENAINNAVNNCQFLCGDVADVLPSLELDGNKPNVIAVNPPRAGVYQSVIKEICKLAPNGIVYISCNAETLARDLVQFNRGGYRIQTVQPVDMFPQTPHVETVVKLVPRHS